MREKVKIEKHKKLIQHYKYKIRHEIDYPMLKRLVPVGTILREVRAEVFDNGLTYGRQIGSYPLIVGIPKEIELNKLYNVVIVGHGFRSITGIPIPVNINTESSKMLSYLPGLGKKRIIRILAQRPFKNKEEFLKMLDPREREFYEKITKI